MKEAAAPSLGGMVAQAVVTAAVQMCLSRKDRDGNPTELIAVSSEIRNPKHVAPNCDPQVPRFPTILLKPSTELNHCQVSGSDRKAGREKGPRSLTSRDFGVLWKGFPQEQLLLRQCRQVRSRGPDNRRQGWRALSPSSLLNMPSLLSGPEKDPAQETRGERVGEAEQEKD